MVLPHWKRLECTHPRPHPGQSNQSPWTETWNQHFKSKDTDAHSRKQTNLERRLSRAGRARTRSDSYCCSFSKLWPTLCDPMDCRAHQASLSFTISWSLLKLTSTESVMLSNHLIFCHPLLLLPSIIPSSRVFSNESALHIRWPKCEAVSHVVQGHPKMDGSWWRVLTPLVSGITSGIHPSLPARRTGHLQKFSYIHFTWGSGKCSKMSYSKYIHKHGLPGSLTCLKVLVGADGIIP